MWITCLWRAVMDLMDRIIKRLRARRGELGLTYRQLEERTGLSFAAIHRILHDKSSPSLANLRRLCDAMQLDLDARPPEPDDDALR